MKYPPPQNSNFFHENSSLASGASAFYADIERLVGLSAYLRADLGHGECSPTLGPEPHTAHLELELLLDLLSMRMIMHGQYSYTGYTTFFQRVMNRPKIIDVLVMKEGQYNEALCRMTLQKLRDV